MSAQANFIDVLLDRLEKTVCHAAKQEEIVARMKSKSTDQNMRLREIYNTIKNTPDEISLTHKARILLALGEIIRQ